MRIPLEDRFWPKVDKTGECWLWTAAKQARSGYGVFCITRTENALAHRMSYTLTHGPIPEGMHVDHLCRVRACVRPEHLELVTPGENTKRGYASRRAERFAPMLREADGCALSAMSEYADMVQELSPGEIKALHLALRAEIRSRHLR